MAWLSEESLRAEVARLQAANLALQAEVARAAMAQAAALSQADAALTRALTLKDTFLALISHELRTPLNAILGVVEALQEEVYGPLTERQEQALALAATSGQQLLGIIADVLDLTWLGSGSERLATEPVDVAELCAAAVEMVAGRAQQRGVQLTEPVVAGVGWVQGEPRRLTQVLTNLLDNAIKFTPAGGQVGLTVTADAAAEQLALTVWDTGIGIAAEAMGRLFQPFSQVDTRLARAYEGIGLGLTLVHRLVALHGGSVALTSTPGAGSRFTVRLPWQGADQTAGAAPVAPPAWGRPPRVLLVDDHEASLARGAAQLAALGCAVTTARGGAEALAQIQAGGVDGVVLALELPEVDGLAVLRQVRADARLAGLPVVALTGLVRPGDRERVLGAGASAYVLRPLGARALATLLGSLLGGGPAAAAGA